MGDDESRDRASDRGRRALLGCSAPFTMIILSFFLPFADACGDGHYDQPLHFVLDSAHDPMRLLWALPPFVAAVLFLPLCLSALHGSLARSRAFLMTALLGLALLLLGQAAMAVIPPANLGIGVFWNMAALGSLCWALVLARRASPRRELLLVAIYAFWAAFLCLMLLAAKAIGVGGYLYFVAELSFIPLLAWGLRPEPAPAPG